MTLVSEVLKETKENTRWGKEWISRVMEDVFGRIGYTGDMEYEKQLIHLAICRTDYLLSKKYQKRIRYAVELAIKKAQEAKRARDTSQ